MLLNQLDFIDILLHITIMTAYYAVLFINDMKHGLHRFVVGYTFGVIAFHYTAKLIGSLYGFLLNHLIVFYYIQHYVRSDNRQTGNLLIGEEFVFNLYYTLTANLL